MGCEEDFFFGIKKSNCWFLAWCLPTHLTFYYKWLVWLVLLTINTWWYSVYWASWWNYARVFLSRKMHERKSEPITTQSSGTRANLMLSLIVIQRSIIMPIHCSVNMFTYGVPVNYNLKATLCWLDQGLLYVSQKDVKRCSIKKE